MIAFEQLKRRLFIAVLLSTASMLAGAQVGFKSVPDYVKTALEDGFELRECTVVSRGREPRPCDDPKATAGLVGGFAMGFMRSFDANQRSEADSVFILSVGRDGLLVPVVQTPSDPGGRAGVFELLDVEAIGRDVFRLHMASGKASAPTSFDYRFALKGEQWIVASAKVTRLERCSDGAFETVGYDVNYLGGTLSWGGGCAHAAGRTRNIGKRIVPMEGFVVMDSSNDPDDLMR